MLIHKLINKNTIITAFIILFLSVPLLIPVNLAVEKQVLICKNCSIEKNVMTYYYDFWKLIPPFNHTVNFVSNTFTDKEHIWESSGEHTIKAFVVPAKKFRVIFFSIAGFLVLLLLIDNLKSEEHIDTKDDLSQPLIFFRLFKIFTVIVLIFVVFYMILSFTVKFTKDIVPKDFNINKMKQHYLQQQKSYKSFQDALNKNDPAIDKRVEEYFDKQKNSDMRKRVEEYFDRDIDKK